jgi:hypothetical protein
MPFRFSYDKMLPNRRMYSWLAKANAYALNVPTSYFLAWIWKACPYLAVHSRETSMSLAMELFYTLFSDQAFVEHRKYLWNLNIS